MYLSRLELDLTRRSTMIALTAPQRFHGAIENSFAGERKRRLWRLDRLGDKLYVLILSEEKPNLDAMAAQFGTENPPETRSYESLLQRITEGSCWRFRLRANPTKSLKDADAVSARGKVKACGAIEEQRQWLLNRAENYGFILKENCFDVTEANWCCFSKKDNKKVSILSVTYEGFLEVTDAEKFKALLCDGIGRGKAYGMGLMTVMRDS